MIKKLLAAFTLAVSIGSAFAAVDINNANSDALRGIKGIGPAKAKAILDEREAHGPFKDAAELSKRVKGMSGRLVWWHFAWIFFKEKPFSGVGAYAGGKFAVLKSLNINAGSTHSDYIELLDTTAPTHSHGAH